MEHVAEHGLAPEDVEAVICHPLDNEDQPQFGVDVDLVYPDFDPDEPCYESETVEFLREVAERAQRADLRWLRTHATAYELSEAS